MSKRGNLKGSLFSCGSPSRLTAHLFIAVLWIALSCDQLLAGAWTQKKDQYYLRLTLNSFTSSSFYDRSSNRADYADNGEFNDLSVFAYLEYGISDLVTLTASVPYKRLKYESPALQRKTNGAGDLYLGVRYLLSGQGMITSIQAGLKTNTGYETDLSILDQAPPLGDGQTDFELNLLLGNSFFNYVAYYNFEVGYRARSGVPVDEVPFIIEGGMNLAVMDEQRPGLPELVEIGPQPTGR